jgi:hypothetical protein
MSNRAGSGLPPTCPPTLRAAFLGEPKLVVLAAGERLYKFVSLPIDRTRILASPWWIRQAAFDELQARARRLGTPLADLVRSQLAIAGEWNPGMDTLFTIGLAAAVDAWEGRARWQPASVRGRDVLFTGGGVQLAVPGLTWQHIGVQHTGWPPH